MEPKKTSTKSVALSARGICCGGSGTGVSRARRACGPSRAAAVAVFEVATVAVLEVAVLAAGAEAKEDKVGAGLD